MATIEPVDPSRICIQVLEGFSGDSSINVSMLRLDRMHPVISGNKWYKLKHNLEDAVQAGKTSLLSFGGAYSNHLIAVAAAAHAHGLSSTGFVRGEEAAANKVLQQCKAYGMELRFMTRSQYTAKHDPEFIGGLQEQFPQAYIIPEGGANQAGRRGAAGIAEYISPDFTHIAVSVGTGTTFAGLQDALLPGQQLLGFAPMKGGRYLEEALRQQTTGTNWELCDRFHFGGFGKINKEVQLFMNSFREQYGFELDRVYTAKMMLGLRRLIAEQYLPSGANLLCIHTGGLTGN